MQLLVYLMPYPHSTFKSSPFNSERLMTIYGMMRLHLSGAKNTTRFVVLSTLGSPPHPLRLLSRLPHTSNNPYVETTLIYAMELLLSLKSTALSQLRSRGLQVTIVADNDFYSQKQTARLGNLHFRICEIIIFFF